MQQIIEVEHCGNDHLEPIYSICEIPVHGFPKPQSGGLWTSPIDSEYSWRKWCLSEDFNVWQLEKSFRLKIDTSQLLIIDSLDDLIQKNGTYAYHGTWSVWTILYQLGAIGKNV